MFQVQTLRYLMLWVPLKGTENTNLELELSFLIIIKKLHTSTLASFAGSVMIPIGCEFPPFVLGNSEKVNS